MRDPGIDARSINKALLFDAEKPPFVCFNAFLV